MKLKYLKTILKNILFSFLDGIFWKNTYFSNNFIYILLSNSNNLLLILNFLKNSSLVQCKQLTDICAVDYPNRVKRFELIYNTVSVNYNWRVFVKIFVALNEFVPSVSSLYLGANWSERECWDLFGIFFTNNTDLRRILTDYGFEGYPLRKDFPLTGYIEIRYDDSKSMLVYEPVQLAQEFRIFNFSSPWEDILRLNKNKYFNV